jgi:uncharacterized protein YbjT (DUF2867 family)
MIKKTALLIGATGLVGNELLNYLLNSEVYEKVKIFTRKRINIEHSKLEQIKVDFENLGQYRDLLNVNDVYCCLGTTIKKAGTQEAFMRVDYEFSLEIAKLARDKSVEKFLIITAMGAEKNSKIFYNRVKGEIEEQLKMIKFPSLIIFRPSLLLGDRKEFRFGEKIAMVLSPLFSFALVGSLRKYRPIHAKDVALSMYLSAQKKMAGNHTILSDEILNISRSIK